jgi:hypothetical protein
MRIGGDYKKREFDIIRNFNKYSAIENIKYSVDSIFEILSLAQHYGFPTRLLDWTHSPLVALHFATGDIEKYSTDGVVWCVNIEKINSLIPDNLLNLLDDEFIDDEFRENWNKGIKLGFTTGILSKIKKLEDFDSLSKDPFALFFEPPSIDQRIINQFAYFSVVSNSETPIDKLFKDNDNMELYCKVIIKAGLKWEIRDKLDRTNMNERILFPSLEGLGKWLTRHYTSKEFFEC